MRSRGVKKFGKPKKPAKTSRIESNFSIRFQFEFLEIERCPTQKNQPDQNRTEIY